MHGMKVEIEVLIEKEDVIILGLRRFNLWIEVFGWCFGGVGDEMCGRRCVVVDFSSLEMVEQIVMKMISRIREFQDLSGEVDSRGKAWGLKL
ncbi:hypothetical protein Tco_0641589 [Tanacetum coccineum]